MMMSPRITFSVTTVAKQCLAITDRIFGNDSLAAQVSEDHAGGIMAGHAGDAATWMRGGAALI